ncbi:NUDIX domain-containing protein [candidate division KSB1 bacterium]|nr:NUDIX domain-containing protein [candidate division KSB1 bacterium]
MDRRTLLKNLAVGFIPLFIFIIADELFDLLTGLVIALGFSFIYLIFIFFREKRIDRFALLDMILIAALGGISVLFANPVFILIKPAIIELIFVILIGVTVFTKNPLLIRMSQRYMKGMELGDQQLFMMRRMLHGLFWLLLAHIILIVLTAVSVGEPGTPGYLRRKEIWAFVSGGLFYIMLVLVFVWQFIKTKMNQRAFMQQYKNDEWFDIVTPHGKVVGKAPRTLCHGNPALLHPVVHVHVFNSRGQLWLQKRASSKKIQPGKWDTSVGGHVSSGEKINDAVLREIKEELGVDKIPHEPLYMYIMKNEIESELVYTFRGFHDGPFIWPKDEIETGTFWKISDIRRNIGKGVFTPNFEQEFGFLEKKKIVS